jgi:hypothetical protein
MAIQLQDVDEIPPSTYRKGPRGSKSSELVERARRSATGKVALTSSDPKELNTTYKSLVQWRLRHKDQGVQLRKDRDVVYIWFERRAHPPNRFYRADVDATGSDDSATARGMHALLRRSVEADGDDVVREGAPAAAP